MNQDRAAVVELSESHLVLAVADGAGGLGDGRRAAGAVIQALHDRRDRGWSDVLLGVDGSLARAGIGETTAVVVEVTDEIIRGAAVGDSAAYIVSGAGVQDLTVRQRRKPLLGSGAAIPVSFECSTWDGRIVLASDGLVKYVARRDIAELALRGSLEEAIVALGNRARLPTGGLQDDIAIVLCEHAS